MTQLLRRIGETLYNDNKLLQTYSLDTPDTIARRVGVLYNTLPEHLSVRKNHVRFLVHELEESKGRIDLVMDSRLFEPYEVVYFYLFAIDHFVAKFGDSGPDSFRRMQTTIRYILNDKYPSLNYDEIENTVLIDKETNAMDERYRQMIQQAQEEERMLALIDTYASETPQTRIVEVSATLEYTIEWNDSLEALFDLFTATTDVPVILFQRYVKVYTGYDASTIRLQETQYNHIVLITNRTQFITLIHDADKNRVTIFSDIPTAAVIVQGACTRRLTWNEKAIIKGYLTYDNPVNMLVFADMLVSFREGPLRMLNIAAFNDNVNLYLLTATLDRLLHIAVPFVDMDLQCRMVIQEGSPRFYANLDVLMEPRLQVLLRFLITAYNKAEYEIVQAYDAYGLTLNQPQQRITPVVDPANIKLTELQPEIFRRGNDGYKSKCQPPHRQPIPLLTAEEEKEAVDDGYATFIFPKEPVEVSQTTTIQPQVYRCRDRPSDEPKYGRSRKNAPYPGLVVDAQSALGFAPCCQVKRQDTKRSSAFVKYYYPNRYVPSTDSGYVRTGSGVLAPGKTGLLPDSRVAALLTTLTSDPIERLGMPKSPNSILSCISEALNVTAERRQLIPHAYLAAQENYTRTINEIGAYLEDDTKYLDPQSFFTCLSYIYNCNFFFFRRDETTDDLVMPYHTHGYVSRPMQTDVPALLIYIHGGSKRTTLEYNQCELLLVGKKKALSSQHVLPRLLANVQARRYAYFYTSYKVSHAPVQFPFNIQRQYLDSKGKIRYLDITADMYDFTIQTSPLPVIPKIPITEGPPRIQTLPLPEATSFMKRLCGTSYKTYDARKAVEGYTGLYMCRVFYDDSIFADTDVYVTMEQTARYLVQWCLFLLSTQMRTRTSLSRADAVDFIEKSTVVRDGHTYARSSRTLDPKDAPTFVDTRGRLIFSSDEVQRRVLFRVLQYLQNDPMYVMTYYKRRVMDKYYEHAYDFQRTPRTSIFELTGANGVLQSAPMRDMHRLPIGTSMSPYLLFNRGLSRVPLVVQPTKTREDASNVASYFLRSGVNPGITAPTPSNKKYTNNIFLDTEIVERVNVDGKRPRGQTPQVMTFKRNDKTNYAALFLPDKMFISNIVT